MTVAPGVYLCTYPHRESLLPLSNVGSIARALQDQHRRSMKVPACLIDVVAALESLHSGDPAVADALTKARWDAEWLVLPCERFHQGGRPLELTALLDDSCISARRKYTLP
jgi:hypothetical protein